MPLPYSMVKEERLCPPFIGDHIAMVKPRLLVPFPGTVNICQYDDYLGNPLLLKESEVLTGSPPLFIELPCTKSAVDLKPNSNLVDSAGKSSKPQRVIVSQVGSFSSPHVASSSRGLSHRNRNGKRLSSLSDTPVSSPNPSGFGDPGNGGCKKSRTIFSDAQCLKMKQVFEVSPYISRQAKAQLAEALDISQDTVAVWFKNQRSKMKKHNRFLERDAPMADQSSSE